jgi:hypothetical protein
MLHLNSYTFPTDNHRKGNNGRLGCAKVSPFPADHSEGLFYVWTMALLFARVCSSLYADARL